MNHTLSRLFIVCLLCISVLYVSGEPFITRVYPTWGIFNSLIYVEGTGFSMTVGFNTVKVNGYLCTIQASTTTLIRCLIQDTTIPVPSALSLSVITGVVESNKVPYGLVEFGNTDQVNGIFYYYGLFSSIPNKNLIIVRTMNDNSKMAPVQHDDLSLSFSITYDFVKTGGPLQFLDGSTNEPVSSIAPTYAPVIQGTEFYESYVVYKGFIFTSQTTVVTTQTSAPGDPCTVTAVNETTLTCTPAANFYKRSYLSSQIRENGKLTVYDFHLTSLDSYQNSIESDTATLTITNFDISQTNIRISGISSTPITPNSATVSNIEFTYPLNAQCGNAFVSDASKSLQRITNSVFLCPNPKIESVITNPDSSNNFYLTFSGKFLNFQQYDSTVGTIDYSIQYSEGMSKQVCKFISQSYDTINSVYTTTCQIPAITNPTSFVLFGNSITGQSTSLFVGYKPTITSITKTEYKVPGVVTITGTGFSSIGLLVTIGGSECKNSVAQEDGLQLTCEFASDVVVVDFNKPLEVVVSVNTLYVGKNSIFFYNIRPTITQCTSTKYGIPAIVTIYGHNFINDQLLVTIGGSKCTDALASQDNKQLTCKFQSDVVAQYNTPLDVFVSVLSQFNATKPVFLYIKSDKNCPTGSNGELCSGHGTCNQQFTCDCNKDWQSSDCSVQDNGGGTIIPDPNVNPNDTSSTIITPGGTLFDVGIVLINEVDKDNNIIQSYNITSINWNNITKQDNQHIYTTTLPNNKSILNVKLSINNLNEIVYYNFAGDAIPILPKSIKYQVELQNYTFSSNLNTMQFIFKSGIAQQGGDCVYESDTNTQTTSSDGSIRSILMVLNGETLIGTFSDRIVLDDRPSYNQVNKLTDTQINQYNLNSQSLYIAITTTSFQKDVIVDPNFGVLVTSTPDDDKCKKKFASWKIALIVVFSVVGVALVITTVILIKKRAVVKKFNAKLKKLDQINVKS